MALLTKYIDKRDVLWSEKTPRSALSQHGREFLDAGRLSDAMDFFERAVDEDGLKATKEIALREGDAFLLGRLARLRPGWVSEEDWRTVERAAEASERPSFAEQARRRYQPLTPELLQKKGPAESGPKA